MEELNRYYLKMLDLPEQEVSREDWIKAEREAGFYPKGMQSNDPRWMTICATGGFGGSVLHGRIEHRGLFLIKSNAPGMNYLIAGAYVIDPKNPGNVRLRVDLPADFAALHPTMPRDAVLYFDPDEDPGEPRMLTKAELAMFRHAAIMNA